MLKKAIVTILILFNLNLYSLELSRPVGDGSNVAKIEIFNIDELNVNEFCFKNKKECINFFIKLKKNKNKASKDIVQLGHPASINCQELGGLSEIYTDSSGNQHDYCNFNQKYIIDSWNLLKSFKK
jgi:putative hemolysin